MQTKLTALLNIKYPIVQGAMAWVSEAHLAASVAEAGGVGSIAAGGRSAEWVRQQIRLAKTLTDKPFGVNLVLLDNDIEQKKQVIIEEGVSFVATGAGNPLPHIDDFHSVGIKVMPVVPNLKLAKRVEKAGADAIVIEGLEAGGHIGRSTTMALMTQVIPEIDIPVIVAGGFADGRGVAAALLMGADGVQLGTRFYASAECQAHPNAKAAIVAATDQDSDTTGPRGHEVRGIKNALTQKYHEMVAAGASEEQLIALVTGTNKKAAIDGDTQWGFVQAGQSLAPIQSIMTCREIIEDLMQSAAEHSTELCKRF